MDNFFGKIWEFYVNFYQNYRSVLDRAFMHTIYKNELFELSDNLCTIIHTMHKNNCVNFSNNSENLVLYRFSL